MSDHQESMDLLNGYRASKRIGTAMYIGAGAAVIASAITLLSGFGIKQDGFTHRNIPNKTGSFVLMGLAGGLGLGGYLIQTTGSRNIEKAVEAYNR